MKKFGTLYVCFCLISIFRANEGARILGIFPAPLKSHFNYMNAAMKSLIKAGHRVTVITPFMESASRQNYTKIIASPMMMKYGTGQIKYNEMTDQNAFTRMNFVIRKEMELCNDVINLPEFQKMLKSDEKLYDVVFVGIIHLYQCYLPVAERMKIPVIGLVPYRTSTAADRAIYNPNNPAHVANEITTRRWQLKSVIGRMINVWNSLVVSWYIYYVLPKKMEKFHLDYAIHLSAFREYMNLDLELVFYNNYATLLPRPMNPNAIDIGGIHIEDAKPLPKDIQNFIDEADRGLILFSLGSVIRGASLSIELRNAFKDAFAELPQRIIWKFEEEIVNLSSNVMLLDWLPQRDILEHKNVIVFITHCGLSSTIEAVHTATTVVACPLTMDQYDNAELLQDREVAVHLDINDITKESVLNALNKIINESKYSENMQKLSRVFKDRPMTPQQQVVYWTEHVIRNNGTSSLKSVTSRLNWFQNLLLDVVLIVLIILASSVYLVGRICNFFHYRLTRMRRQKNKNE